ncbi:hypothetical protein MG296_10710 [Flavobacteriaceae bacterium TK19130]|nr:hypothetical protein [Thermobacterium salinum]
MEDLKLIEWLLEHPEFENRVNVTDDLITGFHLKKQLDAADANSISNETERNFSVNHDEVNFFRK